MRGITRRSVLVGYSLLLVAGTRAPLAADTPASGKRLALRGYDPVSYFTEGYPEKGLVEYQASYDDATYWFKTDKHREMFVADPDHYAPQFQSYCALLVSRGEKREADPEAWVIADGKLYVFAGPIGVALFREQTASVIQKAGENWPQLH